MPATGNIAEQAIARISVYRRLLGGLLQEGMTSVYSHQIASCARVGAAQVRRDIMALGYSGSPQRGYDVAELIECIDDFLDAPQGQNLALIGVGHLGRAVTDYFVGRRPKLRLVALFDQDPEKAGRIYNGVRCYRPEEMEQVVRAQKISIAILTVPGSAAQTVADACVNYGIKGIVNFAPVPVRVPDTVYGTEIDMVTVLERVAYFARHAGEEEEKV